MLLLFNRVGVPSFVITLAGLLGFLGVQLWLLGSKGAVNLPFDSEIVKFAQIQFVPEWLSYVFVAVGSGRTLRSRLRPRSGAARRPVSPPSRSRPLALRSAALLLGLGLLVAYLNQTRGVGWMFVFFIALVLVHALRPDADCVRPVDVRRRRQPGGRSARRHQRQGDLLAPCSCSARPSRRSAASSRPPVSRPRTRAAAAATST